MNKNEKVYLEYDLKITGPKSVSFEVLEQSPEVDAYLAKNDFVDISTGFTVKSADYPELKDSLNMIFLQGKDGEEDNKVDTTDFVGTMQRDNRIDLIDNTLKNFVNDVIKSKIVGKERTANSVRKLKATG